MMRWIRLLPALCLVYTAVAAAPPELRLERDRGRTTIWVDQSLLRETGKAVQPRASGSDPRGGALFATWDEDGERWFSYSRNGGVSWEKGRRLQTDIRLLDGDISPRDGMPAAADGFTLPSDGRLFLVQFRTIGLPEWRAALEELGAEVLNHVPHNAHIVRVGRGDLHRLQALDFVERVEPYHPWYRLHPELRQSLLSSGAAGSEQERVRVLTTEWGAEGKARVLEAALALGASVAEYWPSGHVLELWATHDQIKALAADDDVLWIDRWSAPEQDMDLVRENSGANWLEHRFGYCGQEVRGEILDGGIQADHPDFDNIMFHGAYGFDSHGTATYGIVFGNGDRDGDGNGKGTGHLPCEEHQGIFADYGEFADRFAHTQELKAAPYNASFQTNSWGSSLTTFYNSYSSEMDDIIWQLDIAITQSQSNNGNRSSRPQAWAKNVISVGGVRHYETLDTSDDAWAFGASIGPAADGRIKPDVSYWYDSIYTTTTGNTYTSSFGGTSAATPETAGVVGLLVQMWADNVWETDPAGATVFEKQPHFGTIKALLINSARQYDFTGTDHDLTRVHQGWGLPSAREAYERATRSLVVDQDVLLTLGGTATYDVAVANGESELKVTMVYPDPPGTTSSSLHRINDLNLKVTSPSATIYHGNVGLDAGTESVPGGSPDGVDTVENVFVRNPEAGIWTVEVEAAEINQDAWPATPADDASFALVVTGGPGVYGSGEGQVRVLETLKACDQPLAVRVRDGNVAAASVNVSVASGSEPVPEMVTLQETVAGSGIYTGEIPATSGPAVPGDGQISAGNGETVTVEYLDSDDGAGGVDILLQDSAAVDCLPPVISDVGESNVTNLTATINWTTDEVSDSTVEWGAALPTDRTQSSSGSVTNHIVGLSGLSECTTYYYSVSSADGVDNLAVDDDGGSYFSFETLKRTGADLHSCREGRLVILTGGIGCSDTAPVRLSDRDLNQDPGLAETVTVFITSTTETVPELLTLTETGPDTSLFFGTIQTGTGAVVPGDGIVQATDGDLVTARYDDAADGSGNPAVSFDSIPADCSGSTFSNVAVESITAESARVSWDTADLTTGVVEWGTTPALGNQVDSTSLTRNHGVDLGRFAACERIYFRITATDSFGNVSVADSGGLPFEFNASTIPGVVFMDGFETDTGWSLEGEWEIDAPQGLGVSPGDPATAHTGVNVLGHDLTGLGAWPGDYEPSTTENAISPSIDGSTLTSGELLFQRRLNVANASIAYLAVKDGAGVWNTIYSTPTIGGFSESGWSALTYDVSAYADGNPDFQVRFRQVSHSGASYDAGWNVDQLMLRDGSLPDVDVCGGCGGAPAFAGLVSVTDDDPCADSSVTLDWSQAPAWGTGSGGTYAVYRSATPGFTPGPGTLLASGLTGTGWTDTAVPDDVIQYYVVQAENDETCGSGPANGGVTDGNLVYGSVTDATSQPVPAPVGDTLLVDGVNHAHARLTWSQAADAAGYNVYRSATPGGSFGLLYGTAGTLYEDPEVFGDGLDHYYLVRAADACGNEEMATP